MGITNMDSSDAETLDASDYVPSSQGLPRRSRPTAPLAAFENLQGEAERVAREIARRITEVVAEIASDGAQHAVYYSLRQNGAEMVALRDNFVNIYPLMGESVKRSSNSEVLGNIADHFATLSLSDREEVALFNFYTGWAQAERASSILQGVEVPDGTREKLDTVWVCRFVLAAASHKQFELAPGVLLQIGEQALLNGENALLEAQKLMASESNEAT